MRILAALALGTVISPFIVVKHKAEALFFVTEDCPVSNYYSHEIHRICDDYKSRGLDCELVYIDPNMTAEDVRKHAEAYGHGDYPKVVDRDHSIVKATGAEVTPTAVLVRHDNTIAYRGRIDDFYAGLGKTRRVLTKHDLRDAIDEVLAGKRVAEPETKPVGCYIPDVKFFKK
jgi:hypothetical protein